MSTTEPGGASTLRQRRGKPGEMNAQTKSTELMGGTFAPTAAEVATWRVKDVVDFVDNNLELSAIAPLFAESSVAGPDLLDIEADDLVQMGVENHMHRKKILRRVAAWNAENQSTETPSQAAGSYRGSDGQRDSKLQGRRQRDRRQQSDADDEEDHEEAEFPMRLAILRTVLTVLIFFAVHTVFQYLVLDPWMGRSLPPPSVSQADLVQQANAIQRRMALNGGGGQQIGKILPVRGL
eukprot:INCI10961.2.p1 GENE.INCI10961.2~~INCI10961.2.p1  ORF type:complete len:252 (+),score=42.94 INCI10961.2:46-756(+)